MAIILSASSALQAQLPIIDCRPAELYQAAHAANAINFAVSHAIRSQGSVRGLLPDVHTLQQALAAAGIACDKHYALMGASSDSDSARLVWLLRLCGLEVQLIDGGWPAWLAAGGDSTASSQATVSVAASSLNYQASGYIDGDELLALVQNHPEQAFIIDCRSAPEYAGSDVRSARAGHIPGAINYDWNLLRAGDHFLSRAKLQTDIAALLASGNYQATQQIICYCQSHMRSSAMCLLLSELNYPQVRGYVGSWSDWGNRSDTPIAI